MLSSPLLEIQRRAGATVVETHGWELAREYSSPETEYQALTEGVALLDRTHIGRLRLDGEDGVDLLNRLSTNELLEMTAGQGCPTVLTSSKGRIVDMLVVLRLEDHLLTLTGPDNRKKVADWVDFYTFAEDVSVRDITEETAMLALGGPRATELLGRLTGQENLELAPWASFTTAIGGVNTLIVRSDFVGLVGYDLIVPAHQGSQLWTALLDLGAPYELTPVGQETLEAVRIERGVPAPGKELTEDFNPLEAGLLDLISFTKGCYVGQEVVTRLNTYKKVQKHLVGMAWGGGQKVADNARVMSDGKQIGVVTSSAVSPRVHGTIALGYVRKAHADPGARLTIESADGELEARVAELPFNP